MLDQAQDHQRHYAEEGSNLECKSPSQIGARASFHKLMIILRRMGEGLGARGTPPGIG